MIGAGIRVLHRERPWIRWLSDSAYWVYLVHLPMVVAVQVMLDQSGVEPTVRFLLAAGLGTVGSLLTYCYMVRYTFIGRALHGPRGRES